MPPRCRPRVTTSTNANEGEEVRGLTDSIGAMLRGVLDMVQHPRSVKKRDIYDAGEVEFKGAKGPIDTYSWVDKMEMAFKSTKLPEEKKVKMIVSFLDDSAHHWWTLAMRNNDGAQTMTWEQFKTLFLGQYFNHSHCSKIQSDFLNMKKRDDEGVIEFEQLGQLWPLRPGGLIVLGLEISMVPVKQPCPYACIAAAEPLQGPYVSSRVSNAATQQVLAPHQNQASKTFSSSKLMQCGIVPYAKTLNDVLVGFADAGYLSDPHKGRSQTGYVFTMGTTMISWRSTKQTFVATSSNHSEIIALHEAIKECVWLRSVITHIRESNGLASTTEALTCIYEDNAACIEQMKLGFIKADNTKHISLKLFYNQQQQQLLNI
ncbi:hypothetical protein ACLB2K_065562 [Fragaria x ananassa]